MRIQAKVVRVGGTQAVALPVAVVRELGWEIGDVLQVEVGPSAITVMDLDTHKSVKAIAHRLVRENMGTVKWLAAR